MKTPKDLITELSESVNRLEDVPTALRCAIALTGRRLAGLAKAHEHENGVKIAALIDAEVDALEGVVKKS